MATGSAPTDALARLDRLPRWPWGRKSIVLIGGSFFFSFFDIIVLGAVLPVIAEQFEISVATASLALTASLVGTIVGSVSDSFVADRLGRRTAVQLAMVVFSVGMIGSAFSVNITMLVIARFIAGAGIGADIDMIVTYVSEISPTKLRGRMTSLAGLFGYAGIAMVPLLARGAIEVTWGWRALFLLAGAGGIGLLLARRNLPDSPRYLVARGRYVEAEAEVRRAEAGFDVSELLPIESAAVAPVMGRRMAFGKYWPMVLIFLLAWTCYYFGNYGWLTVAPTLLTDAGYSLATSLNFLIIGNLGLVLGAAIGFMVTERSERKFLLQAMLIVWGVALATIGVVSGASVVVVCGFVAACTIGLCVPIFYTWTAEQFPAHIRPGAVATTDGFGHLGGAVAPLILIPLGFSWGFVAMGISGIVTALVLIAGRRTRGRSLEQLTG